MKIRNALLAATVLIGTLGVSVGAARASEAQPNCADFHDTMLGYTASGDAYCQDDRDAGIRYAIVQHDETNFGNAIISLTGEQSQGSIGISVRDVDQDLQLSFLIPILRGEPWGFKDDSLGGLAKWLSLFYKEEINAVVDAETMLQYRSTLPY